LYLPAMSKRPGPTETVAWLLERMFWRQPGWEHPPLISLLEGLTVEQLLWRPSADRRCIWQYVRHMLAWQSFVLKRLRGDAPSEFNDPWPAVPETTDEAELARGWAEDLRRLQAIRASLIAAVEALPMSLIRTRTWRICRTGSRPWVCRSTTPTTRARSLSSAACRACRLLSDSALCTGPTHFTAAGIRLVQYARARDVRCRCAVASPTASSSWA
jgi:hypothetical protein